MRVQIILPDHDLQPAMQKHLLEGVSVQDYILTALRTYNKINEAHEQYTTPQIGTTQLCIIRKTFNLSPSYGTIIAHDMEAEILLPGVPPRRSHSEED